VCHHIVQSGLGVGIIIVYGQAKVGLHCRVGLGECVTISQRWAREETIFWIQACGMDVTII